MILGIGPYPTVAEIEAANMNADTAIDVADLILMINKILEESGGDPDDLYALLELLG